MSDHFVHLGYGVGTGEAVMIPIRHMVVVGQTQESGKTTTLEALIARAPGGRGKEERKFRAITFITKRGERAFADGAQLQPYFRTQKADWQYVSSLIDVTMGEKNKLLRSFLMKTCRDTKTLADVLRNVRAAKDSSRGFPESIYTEIEGYLELVVPQLAQLPPAHKLALKPGLNVMDVSPYRPELQALVLRSVLDHIYDDEEDVVAVIPEAWEFLPESKGSPVKAAAERLIRKGAGIGNYIWIDSQDLAGVWKTVVRACPVALIGVQREANEIKRTLANIHTDRKPKPADVANLELGEFYVCYGKHAIKTYVQPAGMPHTQAMAIARGTAEKRVWRPAAPRLQRRKVVEYVGDGTTERDVPFAPGSAFEPVGSILDRVDVVDQIRGFVDRGQRAQAAVDRELARVKGGDDDMTPAQEKKLDDLIALVARSISTMGAVLDRVGPAPADTGDAALPSAPPPGTPTFDIGNASDRELELLVDQAAALVIDRLARMVDEGDPRLATIIKVLATRSEIHVATKRHVIETDENTQLGRLALLIAEGYFDDKRSPGNVQAELASRGFAATAPNLTKAMADLAAKGFFTRSNKWFTLVPGVKDRVVRKAS